MKNQWEDRVVDVSVAENAYRQSIEAYGARQNDLEQARLRLAEAEENEINSRKEMEEADNNWQAAKAILFATEQEVAAANFDNRIADLQELEGTATRLEALHSPAHQELLLSYLLVPLGKEA